jgi:hypothetical protein
MQPSGIQLFLQFLSQLFLFFQLVLLQFLLQFFLLFQLVLLKQFFPQFFLQFF